MSKAEERALEAYPSTPNWDERITCMYRGGFIRGYHQAEKDLELTWKDIKKIYHLVNEVSDDLGIKAMYVNIYQEVLKRFNDYKLKEK